MTVTIKTKQGDKQYATVAERLSLLHEAGKALEVLESAPVQVGDGFIWRVLIKVDGLTYVGNAEVHLNSTNFAEKADPWATAETSAIGRAIAWSGYAGTPDSIASADEIVRAQSKIEAPLPSELRIRAKELGKDFDAVVKFLFKKAIPDDELTPNDCQFIQVTFEKSAQIRKQAASGGGK